MLRNGVVIEAFGTGQRIRGRRRREHRPTLIICDDLQNDGHIRSAVQRGHSRDWFHGMLMKAGTQRTNVVNLATALHREALAMQLHETPGWTSRIFQGHRALAGEHVAVAASGKPCTRTLPTRIIKRPLENFTKSIAKKWTWGQWCSGPRRKIFTR